MIPRYPEFRPLGLADRATLEGYCARTDSSDFTFLNLYCFDTRGTVAWSLLHDNLVVRFQAYTGDGQFLSFCGANRAAETCRTLLGDCGRLGLPPELRLIPHDAVAALIDADAGLSIEEDADNHDYIMSLARLAALDGAPYKKHRNLRGRFLRECPSAGLADLDLADRGTQARVLGAFERWEASAGKGRAETAGRWVAYRRLLDAAGSFPLIALGVQVEGELVGFSIAERMSPDCAHCFAEKADRSLPGIFAYLKAGMARRLLEEGFARLNYEQDLGLPGNRAMKYHWHPVGRVRKYVVRRGGE